MAPGVLPLPSNKGALCADDSRGTVFGVAGNYLTSSDGQVDSATVGWHA
jgi:hypothetical protein